MLLVLHILIALSSLVLSTLAVFSPSTTKIKTSFGLIAATLASGTWLVITTHSPLVSSCITGLVYTVISLSLISVAKYRLSGVKVKIID